MTEKVRRPTSDLSAVWSCSTGTSRWSLVDEDPADDADYIYKQDSADSQYFGFTDFDVPAGSTIQSVKVSARCQRTAAGAVSSRGVIRVVSTGYTSTMGDPGTSWTLQTSTDWLTNPNTSLGWTVDDVNGVSAAPLNYFGVGATGMVAGEELQCSQCYCTVTYTEAAGGQPAIKRFGGVPFAAINRGVW